MAVNFDFTSLKQSIIIVQGVILVSCYSIYKVHLKLAVANFDILAHNFSFVKNFFQILSNFFSMSLFSARSPERLGILAYPIPFVKHFIHFFTTFFSFLQIVVFPHLSPLNMVSFSLKPVHFAQWDHFCFLLSSGFRCLSRYFSATNLFRKILGSRGRR